MHEPTLDIGWVPDGFTLADPPGLHIFESVSHAAAFGTNEPPEPAVWRCWARRADYVAPLPAGIDRPYRRISLTWYQREALGPTAEVLLAGLDGDRSYPSADGSGTVYVDANRGRYLDDTYLVQVFFYDGTPEDDIRRMLASVRIT